MPPTISDLANWPKDRRGLPIFTSTHDALLYAQLVAHDKDRQELLSISREDIYIKLKHERHSKKPNLQRMMDLAVKAQFYRECLEECQRIKDERFTP